MALSHKALGKFYGVVLRLPDHTGSHAFAVGAFGSSSSAPSVDWGEACVCCNVSARGRTQSLDVATDRFRASPLDVPVCGACETHALVTSRQEMLPVGLLMTGIGLGAWGAMQELPSVVLGSLIPGLCGAVMMLRQRATRRAATGNGHHPGLTVFVAPRQLLVRTPNPKLAERLIERHREILHRVR